MPSPLAILAACAACAAAWLLGRALARRGITAENALQGRQRAAYAVLLLGLAAVAVLLVPGGDALLPLPLLLALQHSVWELMAAVAAAGTGLLIGLELPGWRDAARRRSLLLGGSALFALVVTLLTRTASVLPLLGEASMDGTVVLQTSPASCAAAAMATLLRVTGTEPEASERALALRAGTRVDGTSTISELRALRASGLRVRFARGLDGDSLQRLARRALLHVNEPVGGTTISHAVALLDYDRASGEWLIANPLQGLQRRRDLNGYWTGEAVLLLDHALPAGP